MIKRYRKTYCPEAMQYNKDTNIDSMNEWLSPRYRCGTCYREKPVWEDDERLGNFIFMFDEGNLRYDMNGPISEFSFFPGDWIVKGINGCVYQIDDETFKNTYEEFE